MFMADLRRLAKQFGATDDVVKMAFVDGFSEGMSQNLAIMAEKGKTLKEIVEEARYRSQKTGASEGFIGIGFGDGKKFPSKTNELIKKGCEGVRKWDRFCTFCKAEGHSRDYCWKKPGSGKCHRCGSTLHREDECVKWRAEN